MCIFKDLPWIPQAFLVLIRFVRFGRLLQTNLWYPRYHRLCSHLVPEHWRLGSGINSFAFRHWSDTGTVPEFWCEYLEKTVSTH